MKRLFARISVLLFFALAQTWACAQTNKDMEALEQAFLNEEYQQVLDRIDAVEKKLGRSPRLESMRAQSYAGLDKPDYALYSILRYEQMVGTRLGSDHPGHAEMLALKEWAQARTMEIIKKNEAQDRKYLAQEARKWDQKFEELRQYAAGRAAQVLRRFDERIKQVKQNLTQEELRYLMLTKSGERFSRIDARSLEFPDLKVGIFSLGLTQAEFESWLVNQVRTVSAQEDEFQRRYAADFRPVYKEKESAGKRMQVFTFFDLHRNDSVYHSFEDFLDRHYSEREAKRNRYKVDDMANRVSGATPSRELYALAPGARICFVGEVVFFEGKATQVEFICRYPPSWEDLDSLQKGVVQRYGAPDSSEDSASIHGGRYISSTYGARNDAIVLVFSDDVRDYKKQRIAPLTLRIILFSM